MQYPPTSDSSALPAPPPGYVTGDESSQLGSSAPSFNGTQACYGADIDLFFPSQGRGAAAKVAEAKALCGRCRFLEPCLTYALTAQGSPGRYVAGVWGGTTDAERTALRRGRGRIRHLVATS